MSDIIFLCRCYPHDYYNVETTVQGAHKWAKRNRDSAGQLQVKRVRWNMLKDSKVVEFKPKIDVKEDLRQIMDTEYLKLVTGGKGPTDDGNWLSQLPNGTMFLVEEKQVTRNPSLGQFVIVEKTPRSVLLMSPDQPGKQLWQNPIRFCGMYNLRETLCVVDIPGVIPKEEEAEDDNRSPDTPEQTP